MIRRRFAAAVLVAVLALAGCGAMPTSSSVYAGDVPEDAVQPPIELKPGAPVAGSDPERIVQDFVEASTSPANNYEIAHEFVASGSPWTPDGGVTVYTDDAAHYAMKAGGDGTATVTLTATLTGTVDGSGVYSESARGETTTLKYTLVQESGEWRIVDAPAGIVIEDLNFNQVYNWYEVAFYDPTWTFLVPDIRWFPASLAESRIVNALVAGPSPGLEGAVRNAFASGTRMSEPAVRLDSSRAVVTFAELPKTDATSLSRISQQLQRSLYIPGVRSVDMVLGSTDLTISDASPRSTAVPTSALVVTADEAGTLVGSQVTALSGLSKPILAMSPKSLAYESGRQLAVFRSADGVVRSVTTGADAVTVDDRPGLIAPTIDPEGYIWSLPGAQPGALHVIGTDGKNVEVKNPPTGVSAVRAMEISRDGTRLAVTGTVDGQSWLGYFPVLRDSDGVPSGVGAFVEVASLTGAGTGLTWLDDSTVGTLVADGEDMNLVTSMIGGKTEVISAPTGAASLAGTNVSTTVRVLTADGVLYTRRGSSWTKVAEGIHVLGVQQVS
ncbi:LpqB family beta-propeller domain-containing protein [Microbacterium gorillae]|uniref:LpqB family beta-propeller domain-containing protein n=1 Tax=Microbacterium gorillae TaxID=1231063 RepID=UPI00058E8841|nr:LpqB family beta-propeller domain-containing protein [Microbacterium gorillae]